MFGAIIGDIVGSRWGFNPTNDYNFEWLSSENGFTDDTICTVAVADALYNETQKCLDFYNWRRKKLAEVEPNDAHSMNVAIDIVSKADIFVIIGTSLKVYPAAGLINYAHYEVPKFVIYSGEMDQCTDLGFTHFKTTATEGMKMLLEAYSKVDRDPRGRAITVAYLAIVDEPIAVTG